MPNDYRVAMILGEIRYGLLEITGLLVRIPQKGISLLLLL